MSRCIIHERSNIIPITPPSSPNKNSEKEYSLKEDFFDPSKSSPPNEFLKKLQQRMNFYNSQPTSSNSTFSSNSFSSNPTFSSNSFSSNPTFSSNSFSSNSSLFIKDDNCDIE